MQPPCRPRLLHFPLKKHSFAAKYLNAIGLQLYYYFMNSVSYPCTSENVSKYTYFVTSCLFFFLSFQGNLFLAKCRIQQQQITPNPNFSGAPGCKKSLNMSNRSWGQGFRPGTLTEYWKDCVEQHTVDGLVEILAHESMSVLFQGKWGNKGHVWVSDRCAGVSGGILWIVGEWQCPQRLRRCRQERKYHNRSTHHLKAALINIFTIHRTLHFLSGLLLKESYWVYLFTFSITHQKELWVSYRGLIKCRTYFLPKYLLKKLEPTLLACNLLSNTD